MSKIALTKSKEFEIRLRYELGEDLSKLALIYKVPLSTLKKRKKLAETRGDMWIKGIRSKIAYERFIEKDEESRRELRERVSREARSEIEVLQEILNDTYSSGILFNPEVENAVKVRSERIEKILELRRNIEEIPTAREEHEIEKIKIENELKRLELEAKKIEVNELKEL